MATMEPAHPDRCQAHGLVVGPDGRCVICRREQGASALQEPARKRGGALVPILAAVGVIVVAVGAFAFFRMQRGSKAPPPDDVQPPLAPEPPAVEPRPAVQPRPAPDLGQPLHKMTIRLKPRPRPRQGPLQAPRVPHQQAPEPEPEPEPEPDRAHREREALAARRRMNRMYEQAAIRGALAQVNIVMYMTDW
jgi:hypothetical protein